MVKNKMNVDIDYTTTIKLNREETSSLKSILGLKLSITNPALEDFKEKLFEELNNLM